MDDSMDFSSDEEDVKSKSKPTHSTKKPSKAASNATATSKRVSLSDSEDYGISSYDDDDDDSEPRIKQQQPSSSQKSAKSVARTAKEESESDDDAYQKRPAASEVAANKSSAQVVISTQQRKVESSSEEEEEEDAVASFMDESEGGDSPPFSAVVSSKSAPATTKVEPKLVLSQVSAKATPSSNAYNEVESNGEEEEESIASKSDYVDSFEEEDFPVTTKPLPAIVSSATVPKPAVVATSESGVYEEENFDEESSATPAASAAVPQSRIASAAQKPSLLEDSPKSEPNFDYSMDFSDDNGGDGQPDEPKPTEPSPMHVIPEAGTQPAPDRSSPPSPSSNSDASGKSDRSEFLDSDRSGDDDDDDAKAEPVVHDEQESNHGGDSVTIPPPASDLNNLAAGESATVASAFTVKPDLDARFIVDTSAKKPDLGNVASEAIRLHGTVESAPVMTGVAPIAAIRGASQALDAPRSLPVATTIITRSQVLIVREYEQPTSERVEMKDASTQFTGNHAAIQADFTPDGMHNLVVDPPPPETMSTQSSAPHHTHPQPSVPNPVREHILPPVDAGSSAAAPPPAPTLPSPGYSMHALRQPSATTTSIYKQQLLALQEQILVKKRETERLVHERMTFQYSTLRGTERVSLGGCCCAVFQALASEVGLRRVLVFVVSDLLFANLWRVLGKFLSSNRPGKLELWQALMRVDPTLTERKAREIARLTNENAAA